MEPVEQNAATPAMKKALVFMPEGGWYDEYYRQLLQPTVEQAGYTCQRGKALYSNCDPREEIIDAIRKADVVISWISGRDSSVIFSLGAAQTLSTPILLITSSDKIEDIPIGHRGLPWIEYQYEDPRWGESLIKRIVQILTASLSQWH